MKRSLRLLLAAGLAAGFAMTITQSASAQDTCQSGYVWREAFPGDHVCVLPKTRTQAARDNAQAAARRQPGGGAYGPNTCQSGYVWREARAGDLVCVMPEVRTQAANDNAAAASRRVARASSGGAPQAGGYRTSAWSGLGRAAGVEYQYRWGWNPQDSKYAKQVDAVFRIRNLQGKVWQGAARSLDCTQNTVSRGTDVTLQPNETREVRFLTPNCGTLANPSFRPNIVRAGRID